MEPRQMLSFMKLHWEIVLFIMNAAKKNDSVEDFSHIQLASYFNAAISNYFLHEQIDGKFLFKNQWQILRW
jgi:hypothetical protein